MSEAATLRVAPGVETIPPEAWNACAREPDGKLNPFLDHAFFLALETSGSASRATGWAPHHLVLEDASAEILGIVPLYLKSHSRGEYVFDQGWAEAYERAGGRYYPKLQGSVPFTPVTGPRLLAKTGDRREDIERMLADAAKQVAVKIGVSSVHFTFVSGAQEDILASRGYLSRTDTQFHWINENFPDFEAFLGALSSRKKKVIRRERREAIEGSGVTIRRLTGPDLTEAVWDAFFQFYMDTGSRKWGRPYLTRSFFSMIGAAMADRILLVMAERGGRYVAGAINFVGPDTIYGRHWGAIEHHPFLHFEICYYQAIDFAIERGLKVVEAGAQGEHKLARGYRPVTTRSAHFIADPGLRRAIEDYLARERAYVEEVGRELAALTPFRKGEAETE